MSMTDLRENLGWIIGSTIAVIVAFLGWFFESGLLNTVIGIAIGAGIAYFVQTRTQKRAWKREYSVKIAEEVYGALFRDVKSIIRILEKKVYVYLGFQSWGEFQNDHRYFMVDEKFRRRLDNFSQRAEEYGTAIIKLENTILPKIANEETRKTFDVDTEKHAKLNVKYMDGHRPTSTTPDVIRCLKSLTHPKEEALSRKSEVTNVEYFVNIEQKSDDPYHSHDSSKFDKFWQSCKRRVSSNKTYRYIIEENDKLLEEARKLKKEIAKRIEEPWRI